jgi:putative chitinase
MLIDKIKPTIEHLQKEPMIPIQIDSVNAIENSCNKFEIANTKQIAYILATTYHESRFKPVNENGKGLGKPYGSKLKHKKVNQVHVPYYTPDKIYWGRGFPQITWYENYEMFGKLLGIDLLNNPELALDPKISADILVLGMKKGLFTGVGLNKYFNNGDTADPIGARKIINGIDCNTLIARYYNEFLKVLA